MHLGRFHKVMWDLAAHFKNASLPTLLEACAASLDQYASAKTKEQLDDFRTKFAAALSASQVQDPELLQPYAQEVVDELSLGEALPPALPARLSGIIDERGFDHVAIATDLRTEAKKVGTLAAHVDRITTGFDKLGVEFESVNDCEAEVGLLLPRQVVGETIPEVTAEFQKLGKLFRAINELTGAADYDPKIRTISSSDWQIFLNLSSDQILVVVFAIERIVTLFQTNLQIKQLQQALAEKDMPEKIIKAIEDEIDKRVSGALEALTEEIIKDHAKVEDQNRRNELGNQLRQGLKHLARRMNEGARVEVNVAVPEEPDAPAAAGPEEEADKVLQQQIERQRQRVAELRSLRTRAEQASRATLEHSSEPQALLAHLSGSEDDKPQK